MKEHFIIPTNFMESGYLFNGAVSIRNAIEAGVLVMFGIFLCGLLPLPGGIDSITYYILICGPLGLVGLFGVQGDPLSTFVVDFFKWRRRRQPCFYSGHSEAYTQEAADLLMDVPQFRDILADSLEKIRQKMAAGDIEYVEGETFEFAEDPEQEALRRAQQEITAKREAETAKKEAEAAKRVEDLKKREAELAVKSNPFQTPDNATAVNAKEVAQMLVLDELDWEDDNG